MGTDAVSAGHLGKTAVRPARFDRCSWGTVVVGRPSCSTKALSVHSVRLSIKHSRIWSALKILDTCSFAIFSSAFHPKGSSIWGI